MNMRAERSARRADYCWSTGARPERRPLPEGLDIGPCSSIEPLAEVIGALRKLKHEKNFLAKVFDVRDKQLFPRDLLVATIPTKRGGRRPIGVLRRSMMFDKKKRAKALTIDFVWVMPEFRSCGLGRTLMGAGLVSGKPKDVHLQVAGSEQNAAAFGLYTSLGFVWETDVDIAGKTEMFLSAELAERAVARIASAVSSAEPSREPSTELPTPTTIACPNAALLGGTSSAVTLNLRADAESVTSTTADTGASGSTTATANATGNTTANASASGELAASSQQAYTPKEGEQQQRAVRLSAG